MLVLDRAELTQDWVFDYQFYIWLNPGKSSAVVAMNKTLLSLLMLLASPAMAQVKLTDFTGYYGGIQLGLNHSMSSGSAGVSKTSSYPGFVLGYATTQQDWLLGVEGFADVHHESTTHKDVGVGVKLGKVHSNTLWFARLGVTGTWPSWRPQLGAGAEFKLQQNVGLSILMSHDRSIDSGITRKNTSIAAGLNYYFY